MGRSPSHWERHKRFQPGLLTQRPLPGPENSSPKEPS